jgi:hypothetical protein
VYRFNHRPTGAEFADPRNLIAIEGQRYTVPAPLAVPGEAYFAVTALDRNYNESDTSNILLVTPPQPPLLALPPDGATAVPESVFVRWHGQSGITSYHLQVGSDPTFAASLLVNDSTLTDTMKLVKVLDGQTTYSWRVRSANMAGRGAFAVPFTFVTGIPRTPTLVYPPPFTTDVPIVPTFVWNRAEAATSYRAQVSIPADFSLLSSDSSGITDTTMTLTGLSFYTVYNWRVRALNAVGASPWSSSNRFRTSAPSSVELSQQSGIPSDFELSQNYPNPFNPATSIQFALPSSQHVTLRVYDILGREETTLIDESLPVGRYTATWNAAAAASGTYFYRLTAGSFTLTKRMLLLR